MSLNIDRIRFTETGNFFLMAGPCVVEGEQLCFDIAGKIKEISEKTSDSIYFQSFLQKSQQIKVRLLYWYRGSKIPGNTQ
jgi:2-dehydro-3-deoxyphosphooctonate aldolase (KDO 8-P synthase)